MTVTATPGTGRRHRVVAIGLGLGGLTATKALKHDLANITDALVFLTRITAQGTSHVNQKSIWLQVIPTTAAVLATLGVLVTLYVAIIRPRNKASQERGHHYSDGSLGYEIVTAASCFNRHGRLWRSQRTPKGWC
jgi:hypothetical protein